MLSKKIRVIIFLSYLITAIVVVGIQILPGIAKVGLNQADPLYFDRKMESTFLYNDGDEEEDLIFNVVKVESETALCEIGFEDKNPKEYEYTHDGYYIESGDETKHQSLFWVHITGGERSEGRNYIGEEYDVFDPVGLFGDSDKKYTYVITEDSVYWPEESALHGAQFSMLFDILDENETCVGFGELDKTCGMIFRIEIGGLSLKLIDTNYDISRNRISALIGLIICVIAVPCGVFVYLFLYKKRVKKETFSKEDVVDITFLVLLGQMVFAFDLWVDVWMYAVFGMTGNFIVRYLIIAAGVIFSLYRRYELKWLVPTILEVLFVFSMTYFVGDSYVPHLTAFMGPTFSFLILLWLTGYNRQSSRSKLSWAVSQVL